MKNSAKFVVLTLVLSIVLTLSSCGEASANIPKDVEKSQAHIDPTYTEIEIDFGIESNQIQKLCYADKEKMIFSISTKKNSMEQYRSAVTDYMVVTDTQGKELQRYQNDSDDQIESVIPYKDGILYSHYDWNTEKIGDWHIVYDDGKTKKTLASGSSEVPSESIVIKLLNGKPVFVYENGNQWVCGYIKDDETLGVYNIGDENTSVHDWNCSGKNICFSVSKQDRNYLIIGDAGGKQNEIELDKELGFPASIVITDKLALCYFDKNGMSLMAVDLKSETKTTMKTSCSMYGLQPISNNFFICLTGDDKAMQFNFKDKRLKDIAAPIADKEGDFAGFEAIYSLGGRECIVDYYNRADSQTGEINHRYFLMEL